MIKPYYESSLGKLYHGDCLEIMPELELETVALVLTDPPYGINASTMTRKKSFGGDDGFSVMFFLDNYLRELSRLLQKDGALYIFTRYDVMPYWWLRVKLYFQVKNCLIWDKGGGGLGDLKGNYLPDYEMIIFATKGEHKLNGKRITSIWDFPKEKAEHHIAQKSLAVTQQIINKSSKQTNMVLDPFLGSGTTAIISESLDRRWIGIEISEEYCEISAKRIEAEASQLKLFR